MYLKRLELSGFKTFADRTELHFAPGMTCIVGPNGVGKSNVADAILWGLGEQSRKALRSASSQDVIFAGTGERAPLGLAEVSLTIDNTDHQLPIDFSEVTVTRRLFRSGETEYYINKARCRLRDIQELFVDTGLGANSYSIVTQGEIDTILSIRPEDRRLMLETVAGIGQYRLRRDESTRKLAATQANITRLNDIIHELSTQRRELEQPAKLAREYNALASELASLELQVLICQHRRHRRRIGALAHERDIAARDAAAVQAQLESVNAEQTRIRRELREAERELAQSTERSATLLSEAERARGEAKLAEERLRSAMDRRATWQAQLEAATSRQTRFAEQVEQARTALEELRASFTSQETRLAKAQAVYEAERNRASAARAQAEEDRAELAQLGEDAARLENEAQSLESLEADIVERQRRLASQRELTALRAAEIDERLIVARRQVEEEERAVARLAEETTELRRDANAVRQTLDEHAQKLRILEAASADADSRCRVLADFESLYQGVEEGVRAALKAGQSGELPGIRGVVGDVLHVPARFEAAIEAALGTRLHWVIVDTQEDARRAILYLRERNLGRASFLPLSSLARVPVASAMLAGEGTECLGVASRLVKCPPEFQKAIDYLLGDTYVVKDLDAALRLHRRLVFQVRCITLDGEIVEKCGAVEGGSTGRPGVAGLSRKRELEEAKANAERLHAAQLAMVRVRDRFAAAGEEIARMLSQAEDRLAEARASLATVRRDVDHLNEVAEAAAATLADIDPELSALEQRLQATRERRAASLARAAELRERLAEMAKRMEAYSETETARTLEEAAQALSKVQVEVADLRARYQAAETELRHAEEQRDAAAREKEAAAEAVEQLAHLMNELKTEIERRSREAQEKATEAETETKACEAQRDLVAQLRGRLERLEQAAAALTETLQEKREAIHRTEIQLEREQAELDHIVIVLRDQFGMSPEEAERSRADPINEGEVTRRASELRRAIRALGPVNPGAEEEYERLKAREETLAEQRQDLEQSREDLLKIIAQIDEETRSVFLDTFQKVSVAFDDLFKRLFGGGETRLSLTNPDNILETGVDVIVKPPGKKQQNLLLLSGGERAMTALALLLAMLRVRPAPFCVMDEIDAPLDAINTGRFVKVLEDFTQKTQFLIITHNPRTMEAADRLYGVTTETPGVSKIITVELADAQRQAERWRQHRSVRGRRHDASEEQASLDLDFRAQPAEEPVVGAHD